MGRYFIEIAYNGTNYHGWQIQKNANSVQAEINKALSTILQQPIMVTGAGRTDTGVHAKQFYAHFEMDKDINCDELTYKLNNFLPKDITCFRTFKVKDDTHARFSAAARTYEYWITPQKNPFLNEKAYYFSFDLDVDKMNEITKELLNHIDFSCFSKSNTQTNTNDCTISEAYWKQKDGVLVFTITANRFLRNMVRAIVGTLLEVGQNKLSLSDFKKIIESKDRCEAGQSVPAHGLYLTKVVYPDTDKVTIHN